MKPNSDYHFNREPQESFKVSGPTMVSLKLDEYHALLAAKEKVIALEEEVKRLQKRVKELR